MASFSEKGFVILLLPGRCDNYLLNLDLFNKSLKTNEIKSYFCPGFGSNENEISFPHPTLAREDGLLGVGGDLSVERLLLAYSHGIFPWYNPGEEILWWCPKERFVIFPNEIHISHSMRKYLKKHTMKIVLNRDLRILCIAVGLSESTMRARGFRMKWRRHILGCIRQDMLSRWRFMKMVFLQAVCTAFPLADAFSEKYVL